MYICQTLDSNEHVLVICDYYSGYIWAAKTGDLGFGTASKIMSVLKEQIRTGLHLTKKIKSEHGTQLDCPELREEMAK